MVLTPQIYEISVTPPSLFTFFSRKVSWAPIATERWCHHALALACTACQCGWNMTVVQMYGCACYIMHHMVTRKGTEKSTMKP